MSQTWRVGAVFLNVLLLLLCGIGVCGAVSLPENGQPIASRSIDSLFELRPASDGVLLVFPLDLAVDRLLIPVHDQRLWGKGNVGKVVVLRWLGGSGIGTRTGSETRIVVDAGGARCRWVEALPIRIESASETVEPLEAPPAIRLEMGDRALPAESSASETWTLEGVPAFQRQVEHRLDGFAEIVHHRQQKQGCFSCHLILPLYSVAAIARERGFRIPSSTLASITADLVTWQHIDGSFSWPEHPEYGSITPTAVAAASLALLRGPNPAADAALQRAIRFLIGRQREDGSLWPDFTFPGFISGPEFTTRALLEALSAGASSLARLGRYEPPACGEARRRASEWLDRLAVGTGPARELAWLALPLAGRFPEASRTANLDILTSTLKFGDIQREPARMAWFTRQLVLLGGFPPEELGRQLEESPATGDSRELWRLMASIWFHFHRETNGGICR